LVWFVLLVFKGGEQTTSQLQSFVVGTVVKGMIAEKVPSFMRFGGGTQEEVASAAKTKSRTLFNL
jgi:hypothetical protein